MNITVDNLSRSFDGQRVLTDIDLVINAGEVVVILGGSGAGKSVLLRHMIGLLMPDTGRVCVDGEDLTRLSERKLLKMRRRMGYLFQQGALFDFMNVYENVAFPLYEHTRLKGSEIEKKVYNVLKMVDLQGAEGKFPSELSGGMIKRAALARAIVLDSRILFCDEPTSGLDSIRSREITDLIRDIARRVKCTTVVTSHDIFNAFRLADRLAIIDKGSVVALGTQDELRQMEDPFVREFIGAGSYEK